MLLSEYLATLIEPQGAHERRLQLMDERNLQSLDRFVGPLELDAARWPMLAARLAAFSMADWAAIKRGDYAPIADLLEESPPPPTASTS